MTRNLAKLTDLLCVCSYAFTCNPLSIHVRHLLPTSKFQLVYRRHSVTGNFPNEVHIPSWLRNAAMWLCVLEQLSAAPGQQPGFSWREVTLRRQQSCQSAPHGSIARPVSAPTLTDVIVVTSPDVTVATSPLPSDGDAVKAAEAAGETSDVTTCN